MSDRELAIEAARTWNRQGYSMNDCCCIMADWILQSVQADDKRKAVLRAFLDRFSGASIDWFDDGIDERTHDEFLDQYLAELLAALGVH